MVVHQAQEHLVQEVAADGAPPSRYVLREHDRPTPTAANAEAIPTVDVSRLAANDPGEAEKLRSALDTWGLFAVTGHGMPEELLDAILDSTRAFFHLPTAAKQKYSNLVPSDSDENNSHNKKFQPEGYGVDRVDTDEQILDWCDRLYLQVQPEDERRHEFWPAEPPNLAGLLHEYSLKSEAVAKLILRAMAKSLGFEESFFADRVGESRMPSYARLTYYPPCARPDLVYGLKPHTDNSVVTVLLLDKRVGGLQVRRQLTGAGAGEEGRWVDVPAMGGYELLVVVGDEMEIMSNAAFRAPVHRVVASAEERMSLVVFYQPEPHRALEPARELVGEGRPARYKTLQAKTFADGFWDAFALGERTIDFLKVKVGGEDGAAPAAVPGA